MNPSTALATVVVDELVRNGVREVVLCPGSRSAPFAYALQQADRAGRLRLHVRVDERSAGFLALGLGKLTRVPVPVFTTSGTAVANLHPAVLEASHSAVPLMVVSADRPAELQGTGANQTTHQGHIFGTAVRMCHELAAPEYPDSQNAEWRSVVGRLCAAAMGVTGPDPGPVHLNVAFREPLVPDLPTGGTWYDGLAGRQGGAPWVTVQPGRPQADPIAPVPKTLVLLGDLPDPAMAAQVSALAEAAGWPVMGEPFGALDRSAFVPHGPLVLSAGEWLERHLPDRVLVIGRPTLTRAVGALLRHPGLTVEIIAAQSSWPDPSHLGSVVHPFAALAASILVGRQVDEQWARAWADAGEMMAKTVGAIIEQAWPSGVAIASTVLAALPVDATLFVGSSNSARDLDLAMSPSSRHEALTVVASRGLAGIDGCVSTAIGLALAQPDRPAYALMGDLTFLHDSNGLLIGPLEPRPDLTIVVTNDDGGGIFALLEPGEPSRATDFERVFGTPTGVAIADICRAHGVEHLLASTAAELSAVLATSPQGLRVVEVPVDRSAHRDLRGNLSAAVANTLR
jgi:2-succinyl-5-enolpyruvyl-6-hydroxy-3-cyclohexene-1-carboxylate synthase